MKDFLNSKKSCSSKDHRQRALSENIFRKYANEDVKELTTREFFF